MPRTNEAVLVESQAQNENGAAESPMPPPKFSQPRRQRRSHLKRMAQENRRFTVDPAERGRRSGQKIRSFIHQDAEGFDDMSDFFNSPPGQNSVRASTDLESPMGSSEVDMNSTAADAAAEALAKRELQFVDLERRAPGAVVAAEADEEPSFGGDMDQSPISKSSASVSAPLISPDGPASLPMSPSDESSVGRGGDTTRNRSESEESSIIPSSSSEEDEEFAAASPRHSSAPDDRRLIGSPSGENLSMLQDVDFASPRTTSGENTTLKRMRAAANAMESPVRQMGMRRSRRIRRKPLEYWKNERIVYERTNEGLGMSLPVPVGVERLSKSTPEKKPRKKRKIGQEKLAAIPFAARLEMPVVEVDIGDDQTAEVELVKRNGNLAFQNLPCSTSAKETKDGGFAETRAAAAFIHDTIRTGMVEIRPEAVKDPESSGDAAQIFHVHKAAHEALLVTINNRTTQVSAGDIFLVPPKSFYEIQNLSMKTAAQLYYTVVDVAVSV